MNIKSKFSKHQITPDELFLNIKENTFTFLTAHYNGENDKDLVVEMVKQIKYINEDNIIKYVSILNTILEHVIYFIQA